MPVVVLDDEVLAVVSLAASLDVVTLAASLAPDDDVGGPMPVELDVLATPVGEKHAGAIRSARLQSKPPGGSGRMVLGEAQC